MNNKWHDPQAALPADDAEVRILFGDSVIKKATFNAYQKVWTYEENGSKVKVKEIRYWKPLNRET